MVKYVLQVLLLMATALNVRRQPTFDDNLSTEMRSRQRRIAEITEMIHVCAFFP